MHQGRRFAMWAIGLLVALAVMFVVHLGTGFSEFSYMDLVRIIAGYGSEWQERVVFDFRMVRSVLAICIGAGLALSGAIFQTITILNQPMRSLRFGKLQYLPSLVVD